MDQLDAEITKKTKEVKDYIVQIDVDDIAIIFVSAAAIAAVKGPALAWKAVSAALTAAIIISPVSLSQTFRTVHAAMDLNQVVDSNDRMKTLGQDLDAVVIELGDALVIFGDAVRGGKALMKHLREMQAPLNTFAVYQEGLRKRGGIFLNREDVLKINDARAQLGDHCDF